jgi:hypothetical protein
MMYVMHVLVEYMTYVMHVLVDFDR